MDLQNYDFFGTHEQQKATNKIILTF